MHHTHLALDPERDAKLWSAIDAQLATIKQADGNTGTPIDVLLADAVVDRRVRANDPGSAGCPRSASTSTTTRCSTACTSTRCVRPPMGSRSHPRRCAVWPVRRRSCRSCSTAPAKCSTAAANTASPTGPSGGRCGRCTAPAPTPAATSRFDRCDIHHVIEWLRHGRTDLDNLLPLCSRHHHLVHEGRWRLTTRQTPGHHHPPTRRHPTLPRHHHQPRRPSTGMSRPKQAAARVHGPP